MSLLSILLAEDDDNDVLLMQSALSRADIPHSLHSVPDGAQAIEYLKGENGFADRTRHPLPAVLLLDIKMPRKSGFEVLQWIRSQPTLQRLPVIVLTSSIQEADVNHAYDLGANSYLVKPATYEDLKVLLRNLIAYWQLVQKPSLTSA